MNLKALRQARGWSQTRLARESGVSQTYISDLEAGKSAPTLPLAKRLAVALGVTMDDLIEASIGELGRSKRGERA